MAKCSFCDKEIERGTGKIFVRVDGRILHFCSRKCEKHLLKLERKAQDMKWVTAKKKGKEVKK